MMCLRPSGIYRLQYVQLSLKSIRSAAKTADFPCMRRLVEDLGRSDTGLPHAFSHPCPRLTANGRSKWPIAESLCNCVTRFHTFQSPNPIRMCQCALRFLCVHSKNSISRLFTCRTHVRERVSGEVRPRNPRHLATYASPRSLTCASSQADTERVVVSACSS